MTKDEALKLALEALELEEAQTHYPSQWLLKAITAIKEALMSGTDGAQPEQEPVAYGMWDTMIGCGGRMMMVRLDKGQDGCTVPLYTTPPQRKPLTQAEVVDGFCSKPHDVQFVSVFNAGVRFAEAAHGIKE